MRKGLLWALSVFVAFAFMSEFAFAARKAKSGSGFKIDCSLVPKGSVDLEIDVTTAISGGLTDKDVRGLMKQYLACGGMSEQYEMAVEDFSLNDECPVSEAKVYIVASSVGGRSDPSGNFESTWLVEASNKIECFSVGSGLFDIVGTLRPRVQISFSAYDPEMDYRCNGSSEASEAKPESQCQAKQTLRFEASSFESIGL